MAEGKKADLDSDRQLNLCMVRPLEIIGEAANRNPKEEQSKYSGIPRSDMISLRNRLIHGYDMVDFDILWQIVTHDLPELIRALKEILSRD